MKRLLAILEAPERSRGHRVWVAGALACLGCVLGTLLAQTPASSIEGRVVNGTTQKPVAGAEVQYVRMMQGMAPAAKAATDGDGRFQLKDMPGGGAGPALLRVEYEGATYSHPLIPGKSPTEGIEIEVYDASQDRKLVTVREQAILVHPAGDQLLVLEQIILENRSKPPRTYVNPEGTYTFTLPNSVKSGPRLTVEGPGGMPISQTPAPREKKGSFAVNYPMRPGETQLRVEYSLDYQPPFEFAKPIDLPAEHTHLVTPGKEVEIKGEGLAALAPDPASGLTGYEVTLVKNVIRVQISGQAPVKQDAEGETVSAEGEGGTSLVPVPSPVGRQRWLVMAAAGLVMLGGFLYLYTR